MIIALALLFATLAAIAEAASAPEQISLNYGVKATEIVVSWALVNTTDTSATCWYGTSKDNLQYSVPATGSTYSMDSYTSPMLYFASIPDAAVGNKLYYYKVGSDATGIYSDVMSFKSHPGVGVNKPMTLHVVGDPGQTENTVNTFQEILDNEAALSTLSGGVIVLGDLSYANGDQPLWDSYGKLKQSLASSIPMMNTPGNHEWFDDRDYKFTAYKARYHSSGTSDLYYSYDVGLAHIVMVAGYCTEMKTVLTQPCLASGTPEFEWLKADLANVDKSVTPWTFVIFHQPYVNSNTHHSMATEGIF